MLLAMLLLALLLSACQPITKPPPPPTTTTAKVLVQLSNQPGRALITARTNHFLVASAPSLGHAAEEVNPIESLLAALATCGIFVYETAAQQLAIPLQAARATVQGDFDVRGLSGAAEVDPHVQAFRVHMALEGPDTAQAAMLAEQFSSRCPVYTTLIKAAPIVVTTNEEAMGGPVAAGLATSVVTATLSNQAGRALVNVRNNNFVVDSPGALGGPNEEINPLDLLLAAQGTCGAFIIEKAAQDGSVPLAAVTSAVEADFNPQGLRDGSVSPHIQAMRIHWQITGPDSAQAEALVDEWLQRCPIYNTLIRATAIEVTIN
jgi:uncharacterized OsmC-like protein